jgi:hypothetical protein
LNGSIFLAPPSHAAHHDAIHQIHDGNDFQGSRSPRSQW